LVVLVKKLVSKNSVAAENGTQPNITAAGRMNVDSTTTVDTSGLNFPVVNARVGCAVRGPFNIPSIGTFKVGVETNRPRLDACTTSFWANCEGQVNT
jgi:hypothetical protein